MSAFKKNILVGITVLTALVLLGWMILKFGNRPALWFTTPRMSVEFMGDRADGLGEGSGVRYRGVTVGQVTRVRLSGLANVKIAASVDQEPPLPGNVVGVVRSTLIGGGAWIDLEVPDEQPEGQLPANARLPLRFGGVDLVPKEITELATEIRALSEQFRRSQVIEHLDETIMTAQRQFVKVGTVIESVQDLVGDKEIKSDIRQAIANFRAATESARQVSENLDRLAKTTQTQVEQIGGSTQQLVDRADQQLVRVTQQLSERLQQVAVILDNLNEATAKLNKGEGSAAMLLNDPRLYENLVDTSRELNATVQGVRRLVEQWEEEGLSLKVQ